MTNLVETIARSFSVNDRDFPGNTPLHWACHMAAENSINFLLSWINDINI